MESNQWGGMLFEAKEIKVVSQYRTYCNGNEGGLGHPGVWLQIPRDLGAIECPYCSAYIVHESHESRLKEIGTKEKSHPPSDG